MNVHIRPFDANEIDDVVELSLLAWEPVFHSFRRVMGPAIYARIYPDWTKSQADAVESVCKDSRNTVWVVEEDGVIAGFIAYELNVDKKVGEVQMLAVHPEHQNRGLGTHLNTFALDRMRASGMEMAEVMTGGDPGHAPARRCYEKAGYTGLPLVRYYKALGSP